MLGYPPVVGCAQETSQEAQREEDPLNAPLCGSLLCLCLSEDERDEHQPVI